MRLIDADEVVKFYKNMGKEFPELRVGTHFSIADIISNLDNIPTVKKEKIMAMTNAEWMIQQGYKFSDLQALDADKGKHGYRICIATRDGTYKKIGETENIYSNRLTSVILWLDEEHVEPILDDAEKRYLSAVIKPFRGEVKYIFKDYGISGGHSFERVEAKCYCAKIDSTSYLYLPVFKTGTMYKGMETNRKYTLEELGL